MTLKINKEKLCALTICLELLLPVCKYCVIQSIPNLYQYNDISNTIISIMLMPLVLISMYFSLENINFFIKVLFGFSIPVLYTITFYSSNSTNLLAVLPRILTVSIPMLCVSRNIKNADILFSYLYKISHLEILFIIFMQLNIFRYGNVGAYDNTYSMSLGYYSIVPIGILFCSYLEKNRRIDLLMCFIGITIVFISGSRGPLLSIALLTTFAYCKNRKITYKQIFLLFFISIILLALILFFQDIIDFLIKIFDSQGISSRTLIYLKYGNVTSLDSRREIQQNIFKYINDIDVFGNGVLWQNRMHNIFIETIYSFGFIIGILLNIILVFIFFKTYFGRFEKKQYFLLVVFASYSYVDAMLNLTVLGKDIFWIFLGLFISFYKKSIKKEV